MHHSNLRRTALAALFFAWALILGAPAHAGNIFDDDWTPAPKPTEAPAPVVRPRVTPPDTKPKSQETPTPPPPVPPAPGPAIRPVPSAAEQAAVRKLFKEIFAKQLADRNPATRRALAGELLEAARKPDVTAVDRFVLLMGARQAAMEALDLPVADKAIDALAGAFNVDGLKLKLDAALKSTGKAETLAATVDNCRVGLGLVDQLLAADDYRGASQLVGAMQAEAANDPMFSLIVARRVKDVEALRGVYGRMVKDLDQLKTTPNDPVANLAVGSFLCYFKRDWGRGLPYLLKGSDPVAKELADAELHKPLENESLQKIGDGWWELAEKQGEVPKRGMREHAAAVYGRALDGVTGLRRVAMEKRIAEGNGGGRFVDLLALSSANSGAVRGKWEMSDAGLLSKGYGGRFEFPYAPPAEYMFRIEFTRTDGNYCLYQYMPTPSDWFSWTIGMNTDWVGLECIHGKIAMEGPVKVRVPNCALNGRSCVSIVEIRKDRVRCYLEGKSVVDWKTDFSDLGSAAFGEWTARDRALLAVGIFDGTFIVHHAEVLELTGEGKIIN